MTPVSVRVVMVGTAQVPAGGRAATVAAGLGAAGLPVTSVAFVDDDEVALEGALAAGPALTFIVTGPGGSSGDVVRRVLGRLTGARLVLSERMRAALEDAARRRDRPLERRAERLALLPQGATVWTASGSDPAWVLDAGERAFIVRPHAAGLDPRLERQALSFARAWMAARAGLAVRILKVTGVGLGEVEERLANWLGPAPAAGGAVDVSVLPVDGDLWVRLRARGATPAAAAEGLATVEEAILARLGEDCYGRDDDTLERVVGRLLAERKLTLAVAESCTGGLLGHRITNVPGSSAYFERGVVAYSNRAKRELLGVSEAVLGTAGAVSAPCAEAMARGIAERTGSDCALAITGIAGPEGGTTEKPVGTVFIGLAAAGRASARRFLFADDRASIKWQSTQRALDLLRRHLLAEPRSSHRFERGLGPRNPVLGEVSEGAVEAPSDD